MRVWALFTDTLSVPDTILEPPKSLMPVSGIRSTTQAPIPIGYPNLLTDDELCEWMYRIRAVSLTLNYGMTGTNPDNSKLWTVAGSATGILTSAQDSNTERNLVLAYPLGAQGGFQGTILGTEDIDEDGDPIGGPIDRIVSFTFAPQQYGVTPVAINPYWYRTDLGQWLPAQNPTGAAGQALIGWTAFGAVAFGGQAIVAKDCTIHGRASQVNTVIRDFLSYTSFTLTITPVEWWPYADSLDLFPIWDAATGAQLRPNTIPMG